jgi:hypothetical protein
VISEGNTALGAGEVGERLDARQLGVDGSASRGDQVAAGGQQFGQRKAAGVVADPGQAIGLGRGVFRLPRGVQRLAGGGDLGRRGAAVAVLLGLAMASRAWAAWALAVAAATAPRLRSNSGKGAEIPKTAAVASSLWNWRTPKLTARSGARRARSRAIRRSAASRSARAAAMAGLKAGS